ncbi:MAG: DNA polymerase III subunit alpha [Calditrichia bacterium]|nr:DNA polymerase III subunit alpha [Calditrichota bacterium]MCB0269977.1 DNA polymerase III subunit alpha [Calditrichota bacterium]
MDYVHLHNHTEFSLLDGANSVKKLVAKAVEYNMPALAITDHGNMFGALEFYKQCKSAGIKPIIGMEAYMAPGNRRDRKIRGVGNNTAYHLLILAKNNTGYRNLMKLSSYAYLEGFYYKPRIDKELLRKYSEGLIVTSACMSGEISSFLQAGDKKGAMKCVDEYRDIFGDDYYMEIQNHNIPDEVIYDKVYSLAKEMNVPVIATNDCHYLNKGHHDSHDVLVCISSGKTVNDPKRLRYGTTELYVKNVDEMYKMFPGKAEALERTLEIAEKIDVEIEMGVHKLPNFPLPEEDKDLSLDDFLKKLSFKGVAKKYGDIDNTLEERLKYELSVIEKTGFAGYFLIVQDFINHAREQGIPVGLGRGSAAGSMVAYALGITNVDPIRYDLLFERFLNPERISMPDIDIDFCFERREEVIDYVRQKYGEENVAQIITFGTMLSKGVIRDVARALEIDLKDADRISKLIPVFQGKPMKLEKAFEEIPELKEIAQTNDPKFQELIRHAKVLEGLSRHSSVHAAGIIIAPEDITNFVPLYQTEDANKQKVTTTQFTMGGCEEIGLLKMDFLGLRTLTVISKCVDMVQKRGIKIDIDEIPLDDPATYEIFCDGSTVGIFQFESKGMQEYLRKLQPNRIEDLIAMNALYRPGPMENIDTYIDRKFGRQKMEYLHPLLEPILKETNGIIVYQEQVMRVASDLAGFSLGKADILRRAMGKKKLDLMAKMEVEFVEGCAKKNIDAKTAKEIYQLIFKFASYGFNKSHSAAYSILAYQTAYLKRHYPAEFMAATLTSEINDSKRLVVLIDECKRMGLEVVRPDIQYSGALFDVPEDRKVSFGLTAIKGVGKGAIQTIIDARERVGSFTNIFDFAKELDLRACNKKVFEALVQAGAFDSLEGNRAQKFAVIEMALSFGQKCQEKEQNKSQISLFDMPSDNGDTLAESLLQYPPMPAIEEWPLKDKLQREKDLLGFYISGHPIDKYANEIKLFSTVDWDKPETYRPGTVVKLPAMISILKRHMDRKGRFMAFVTFEDKFNSFEGVVFSSTYEKYAEYLRDGEIVFVTGKVDDAGDQTLKMLVDEVIPMSESRNRMAGSIKLKVDTSNISEDQIDDLYRLIQNSRGSIPLFFNVYTNGNGEALLLKSRRFKVLPTDDFLVEARKILGDSAVEVT